MSGDGKGRGPVRRPRVIGRPRVPPGPLADLKALVYELYLEAGAPTLDEIAAAIAADDGLAGAPGRDTIGRVIGDPGLPASQADVVAVVTVLARAARWDPGNAAGRARDLWVAARMACARYPAAGILVCEADPRRLGVHAAISVPGVPDEVPPEYVPRDADGGELGVRARVAAAAERGGFVLLVGGSSVGKTRCAFEAVTALLPEWWLVHPVGPTEVAALAQAPTARTVVWLDELQRYLDGEHGLTGGMIRALLNAPDPLVIVGTMWPKFYTSYTTLPEPGGDDPHAREREVLDLTNVVRIGDEFSPAEQDRARAAAARDPRLKVALGTVDYGLTQTLAAAPQLVAHWEDSKSVDPYARAVLTAALDATRLGARAPLTADFLQAAAPGYCTSQQQAEAPEDWFEQALAYATKKLHGAVAALRPTGARMGLVAGYTAADYLIQHASQELRYERVPASTWDAVLSHIRDPADTSRLADSARNRLRYCYAILLYRHAADAGDRDAAVRLAELLKKRGDLDEAEQILRARADAGDGYAAERLARLLADRGDLDELRARADAGDEDAAERLAILLADRGDLDELRARADAGDGYAAWRLAELLKKRGDLDEAEQILRAQADVGDGYAAELVAEMLAELLADRGELDEAEQILRVWADAGDEDAAGLLAELLADRGDLDELRARADAGDAYAVELLADCGELDEAEQILRARADAGDEDAAWRLARLLAQRGDLDGLRALANADERYVIRELIIRELADLLARRGDLDGLRALANAGDRYAVWLLAKCGDLDEAEQIVRARADAGDEDAARLLAELLADCGELDEAEQILRARVDAGDWRADGPLADLLIKQGRSEEAERLRRFGLNPDGSIVRA